MNTDGFFVHIVESPSPEELFEGKTEGKALCAFLELCDVPHTYHVAVNLEQFQNGVSDALATAMEEFGKSPILHLSCHGCKHGIQLTSQRETGEYISWPELSKYVRRSPGLPLNGIPICVSACEGIGGFLMANVANASELPFCWLVGTSGEVAIYDIAMAFALFYRGLQRGEEPGKLIPAIRDATGLRRFGIVHGDLTQALFAGDVDGALAALMRF